MLGFFRLLAVFALSIHVNAAKADDAESVAIDGSRWSDLEISDVLKAQLKAGKHVRLFGVPSTRCVGLSGTITFGVGAALDGVDGVCLEATGDAPMMDVPKGADSVSVRNVRFDQLWKSRIFAVVRGSRFHASNIRVRRGGALIFSGAESGQVDTNSRFEDGIGEAAVLLTAGSKGCRITDANFQRNSGFGVDIGDGAHDNEVSNLRTDENRIELIGVRWSSFRNIVRDNLAAHTGDNGISISGDNNIVEGNVVIGVRLNGIAVYGSDNIVRSNVVIGNGRNHSEDFIVHFGDDKVLRSNPSDSSVLSNVLVNPAFGGTGSRNTISSNVVEVDRKLQDFTCGLSEGTGYRPWRVGMSVTLDSFAFANGAILKALSSGKSGAVVPDCSPAHPDCSDGGAHWRFVREFALGGGPISNTLCENRVLQAGRPSCRLDVARRDDCAR